MRVLGMREPGEGEREAMLDDKNRKLLKILSSNSKTPLKELARAIGLSLQATHKRLKSLEERGVIRYTISVNPKLVGRGALAFIFVDSTAGKEKELSQILSHWPDVCEIHEISSERSGLLLKVRARDQEALARLQERVKAQQPEAKVRVLEVIRTIKEANAL